MNDNKKIGNITIEGARIIFRNFQGRGSDYNAEGNRNFGLILDQDLAKQLEHDGWNVKHLRQREDEDAPQPYLQVKVKYGKIPPIVYLVSSRGKTKLDESTIGQLDWARIATVDLIVRPYVYPATPLRPSGVAAYLKSMYVTIQEDLLDEKYGDIPDVNDTQYT